MLCRRSLSSPFTPNPKGPEDSRGLLAALPQAPYPDCSPRSPKAPADPLGGSWAPPRAVWLPAGPGHARGAPWPQHGDTHIMCSSSEYASISECTMLACKTRGKGRKKKRKKTQTKGGRG